MSKKITLWAGGSKRIAFVDDEDFDMVNERKWYFKKAKEGSIATNYAYANGWVSMHRLVLNAQDGETVDHINGNGLDNRKANLRICNQKQNCRNSRKRVNSTSQYKGVYHRRNSWEASITSDSGLTRLGAYATEKEAACAYNGAAMALFGDFGYLNDVFLNPLRKKGKKCQKTN